MSIPRVLPKSQRLYWIIGIIALQSLTSLSANAHENLLPSTISKIKSSVVAVGTYSPTRAPRALFKGTGFAIGDGSLIATNAHVLPTNSELEINEKPAIFVRIKESEASFEVKTVATDEYHDLAILKLDTAKLTPLSLDESSRVQEGQSYAFTGFPIGMVLGLYPVTHQGVISAISPNIIPMIKASQLDAKTVKQLHNPYMVFQLDATAYPGNSGSPLYHPETGRVIGIVNKVFIQESKEHALTKPSGISYAIPIEHLQKLLQDSNL